MKIYLAGSWPRKDEVRIIADTLAARGHSLTSTWHHSAASATLYDHGNLPVDAVDDRKQVNAADVLVAITGDKLTQGGRHSEFGIALQAGKRLIVQGPREQVFHHDPIVCLSSSLDDTIAILDAMDKAVRRRSPSLMARVYDGLHLDRPRTLGEIMGAVAWKIETPDLLSALDALIFERLAVLAPINDGTAEVPAWKRTK